MPQVLYTNNAVAALAAPVSTLDSTVTVTNGVVFPSPSGGNYFYLTIDDGSNIEIVKVTARSGDVLTVTRAQQGTTLGSFATSTPVALRVTAGGFEDLYTEINLKLNSSAVSAFGATLIDDADAAAARTTLGLGNLATVTATAFALSVLDDADASAVRTTLGLASGATTPISAFGATLVDDADAATMRATLGLGTAATQNTGTSGANVPLLNAANTWSSQQTFSSNVIASTGIVLGTEQFASRWTSADTDIDPLIPGTALGVLLEGPVNGHVTIGIRGNDTSDGLYIIDNSNDGTTTYSRLLASLTPLGLSYFGAQVLGPAGTVSAPGYSFSGDPNTGFYSVTGDVIGVSTGGALRFSASTYFYGAATGSASIASAAGTASLPAYTFVGDENTGIYRSGADQLSFATGGTERLRIASNGSLTGYLAAGASTAMTLQGDGNAGVGPSLVLSFTSGGAAPTVGNDIGRIVWNAFDSGLVGETYGYLSCIVNDATAGSEDATFSVTLIENGVRGTKFSVSSAGLGTFSERVRVGNGTAALPAYSTTGDPDTGWYWNSSGIWSYAQNGTARFNISDYFFGATDGGAIKSAAGTAALPALTFVNDTDTGLYPAGANILGFATAGTARFGMTTVFYGSGGTGAPAMTSAAGAVAAPAFTFVTDTDTGLYRVGADNLGISLGGVKYVDLAAGFANFSMPIGSHGSDPNFNLYETDAGADAKRWDIVMSGGTLFFRAVNDAYSSASNWLLVTRSGASPVAATFGIDAVLAATAPTSTLSTGFRGVPVADRSGSYTLVKTDAAYCQNYTGTGGHTFTIPANASVDYPRGTVLTFINTGSGNVSIAITTDTMRLVGSGGTGTRTLAPHGQANAHKITDTLWYISGTNLT